MKLIEHVINNLENNKTIYISLFSNLSAEETKWKAEENKWCLLEILCHLYDEEREDFRYRFKHVLETKHLPMPPIDPSGWVTERKYIDQNFNQKLSDFLTERQASIEWLCSLKNPDLSIAFNHEKFGPMSAELFLTNWLAHDYIHIRQIIRTKYQYLNQLTNESLSYAGDW